MVHLKHLITKELIHHLYTYNAKIVSVYDGDSMDAVIDLGFNISTSIKLRLSYIDTPELRGPTLEEGRKVRDIVKSMILDRDVILRTEKDKTEKYGRYLAEIFVDNINLNLWLVENGYAQYYI